MLLHFFRNFLAFFLLLGSVSVNAGNYDEDVLEIYSKLLPRFIVMSDQSIRVKDEIHICLLEEEVDETAAISLKERISCNYPQGIKNYKIKMTLANYTELSTCKNSELLFLFNSSKTHISETLAYAKRHNSMTVSYDASLLEEGVSLSLYLGRKTLPYINTTALKRNGITLDPILLRISKLYMQGDK